MTLQEIGDAVKAWNSAQDDTAAPLSDREANELAGFLDRFAAAGTA